MEKLYEYESAFHSDGRPKKFICQGRERFIEKFIPRKEFDELFGGFILSGDGKGGEEFIGVWGKRKCQSFRRILRERGAEFVLIKDIPDFRRIRMSE